MLLSIINLKAGYIANTVQNQDVLDIMRHCFSTIPAALWILTGIGLMFYKLDRKTYNGILSDLAARKGEQVR